MLIALVGMDGTGKSTQAELLSGALRGQGREVVSVWSRWEPALLGKLGALVRTGRGSSSTAQGESVAAGRKLRLMQNPLLRVLWLTTAIAEYRLQVSARVSRELRPGRIVIADRYLADFIVDQELNVGLAPSDVSPLYHYPVMRTFPSPDLTVVLDLDPVTAASRKSDGTTAEYLRRRREHYLAIGAGSHAAVVDASLSADVVHAKILSLVTARLGEAIR